MYKITRPQFLFRAIMIYRVQILKFFLPSPSGPTKNKKTFKKWTQCLLGQICLASQRTSINFHSNLTFLRADGSITITQAEKDRYGCKNS
jgi:hypothetical protein